VQRKKKHFAKYCKQNKAHIHGVDDEYLEPEYLISQVCTANSVGIERLCAELIVNDQLIAFQIDTGATNNLIGKNGSEIPPLLRQAAL
jgi:hypothetical protein